MLHIDPDAWYTEEELVAGLGCESASLRRKMRGTTGRMRVGADKWAYLGAAILERMTPKSVLPPPAALLAPRARAAPRSGSLQGARSETTGGRSLKELLRELRIKERSGRR